MAEHTTGDTPPEPGKRSSAKGSAANGTGSGPLEAPPLSDLFGADINEFMDVEAGGALGLVTLPLQVELKKRPEKGVFCRAMGKECWGPAALHIPAASDQLSGGPNTIYLLAPPVAAVLDSDVKKEVFLVPAVTAQGSFFMWYVPRDVSNSWNASMVAAANAASRHWVKVTAKRELNQYVTDVASKLVHEPQWPAQMGNLLQSAFPGDRMVRARDHHLVKRLLGEAL